MQILEPPTESYTNESGHFIKTFLISTKHNEAGWKINKATIQEKIGTFIGKPFVIISEHLSSERQKGHVFANSRDGLLEEYKKHTHGIIESISQPYSYQDGTDDVFYTANIKLNDSKAASALLENGAKTWVPFAVSPHIWHIGGPEDNIDDWEGISLSLVPKGAYGEEAVINKYCKGDSDSCNKSLAAANLCDKEDSKAASLITSLVSSNDLNSHMAQVAEVKEIPQVAPVKEEPKQEKKEDVITLTKAEYQAIEEEKSKAKKLESQVTELLKENKANTLNSIFTEIEDEKDRKIVFDKYFKEEYNAKHLSEFYNDISTHILPNKIKKAIEAQAKEAAEAQNKDKPKSKAASNISLPKEPEVEESKAASIVPKSVNEIYRFRKIMEAGF